MRHFKFRLVLLISFLSLCFLSPAFSGTYFVATNGSDSGGKGSLSRPWKTVVHALENARAGDTISIKDGIYAEDQLVVPVGVSIASASKNNNKVKIHPKRSLWATTAFISLSSKTPGTSGNQSISYIEFDGVNGSNVARNFILVQNRNNVRIHHCNIHDFSDGSTEHRASYSNDIKSTSFTYSGKWKDYWPENPQAPGKDTNIDALWPSGNPVEGFEFDNNTVNKIEAFKLRHVKNSSFHDNIIDNRGTNIRCIYGTPAFVWNVDIYNNTFYAENDAPGYSDYIIELWIHRNGCEYYNNTLNGCYSLTIGKETSVHDNIIIQDPPGYLGGVNEGYGIEFNLQNYSEIYNNFISGAVSGLTIGVDKNQANKNFICEYTTVRNNVIHNPKLHGIFVKSYGHPNSFNKIITRKINIYHNVIDGQTSAESGSQYNRGDYGIAIMQEDNGGTTVLSDVNVKNNIVIDINRYAGSTTGSVSRLSIDSNLFSGNRYDKWKGSIVSNTKTKDPNFAKENAGFLGYKPVSPSDAIDGGVAIYGYPYHGSAPDIGAVEIGKSISGGGIEVPDPKIAMIVDNTSDSFSFDGSWNRSSNISGYYKSDYRYTNSGNGTCQAKWSFRVNNGAYDIAVCWVAHANRASNALYRVFNNGVEIGSQVFNQQENGGRFNFLDNRYIVKDGSLDIVLTDNADGYVIADAVKLICQSEN